MNILWFAWKDSKHPEAGGAEVVSTEIRERLVKSGHQVALITSKPPGLKERETINGVTTLRGGGKFTVYSRARKIYKRNFTKNKVDLVIDEMNTIPFMSALYVRANRRVLLTYQLARVVWFYQMPLPFSFLGYCLEPLYLRIVARLYADVVTESQSTAQDLRRHGFKKNSVAVFDIGMHTKPVGKLTQNPSNRILFFGALRPMKRPLDAVKAFEVARDTLPDLTLDMAGNDHGPYAERVRRYVQGSRHAAAITLHGSVSEETKLQLMQEATLQLVTSIKEGWGLIITEANSQGTPVIAYDVDGVRDSIDSAKTGILVKNGNFRQLGKSIVRSVSSPKELNTLREAAWQNSKKYTLRNSFESFAAAIGIKR